MEDYKSTEVYAYLNDMYYYLTGDLSKFHRLCAEAEIKEQAMDTALNASSKGSMFGESQSISSTSIAYTTRHSGSDDISYNLSNQNKDDTFRLTIPMTLSLFATIDCLGYLSGANNEPTKTEENFKQFFQQSSILVTNVDSDFINKIFRQGLTHVYFPKLRLAVSYHTINSQEKLIFRNDYGYLVLNINWLEEIVISTFDKIKNNPSLYPEMETKYQSLLLKYETEHRVTINNYRP